jgi:AcrR family transcriptional regulator
MRPAKNHRPELLKAAARLFAQKQFHEVLMEDVADEAGVAKGTVYRFFCTKDDLYVAVCLEFLDELTAQLTEVAQRPDEPRIRLECMAILIFKYFHARRDFFQVMQREWGGTHRNALLARRSSTRSLLAQVLKEGQQGGAFRDAVNPDLAADGLMGMIRNFVRFGDPRLTPDQMIPHLLDLFLHGMAASEGRGKESPCRES